VKEQLERTESCIAFDRLGGELTAAERAHLAGCSRCEAELALAREFESSVTEEAEADAVRSIVSRLQPPRTGNVVSIGERRKFAAGRSLLAVAATLFLALGVTWFVQQRQMGVHDEPGIDRSYRSLRVDVFAPAGDVTAPPTELRWAAVPGAVAYDVALVEVDGTTLWTVKTRVPRVDLPRSVSVKFVPGKTVLWQVTARGDGKVLADSGLVKFRVVP
jgi:hypothetical protein